MVPSIEQWLTWGAECTHLPYVQKFKGIDIQFPQTWEPFAEAFGDRFIILESGKNARYTYLSPSPNEWLTVQDQKAILESADGMKTEFRANSFEALRLWIGNTKAPSLGNAFPPFLGGIAGWISYDSVRCLENIPVNAENDLDLPDMQMYRVDECWVWDHEEQALFCAVNYKIETHLDDLQLPFDAATLRANEMKEQWISWTSISSDQQAQVNDRIHTVSKATGQLEWDIQVDEWAHLQRSLSAQAFTDSVKQIQEYIRAGDVFQVNLSVRQSVPNETSAIEIYEWLRAWNPSPYMGVFHAPDYQLVSGSPELLVKTRGRKASTRPIAGTRPRGKTAEEDVQLEEQLRSNEKECAEHVMLVDLERNDLGRVCQFGTVKVSELFAVERYSHVMHLVSEVVGELAPGKDGIDLLSASFPGGTITGAPKIRTMEIIEELETVRRGPYTGSMGWFGYDGNMEMNILIRTLVQKDGTSHIQAGAGIVIDSIPEKEYQESLNKAKALWKALMSAQGQIRSQKKLIQN